MMIWRKVKIKVTAVVLICGWLLMMGGDVVKVYAQTPGQGREFHETYDLSPNGTVSVNNVSGNIRVTTWNENRVRVDAVKTARREEDIRQVEIQVTARPEQIDIRTIYPRGGSNSVSVNYDLKVPRTAGLNPLNTTSGDITVNGPVTRVIARSTSGNVTALEVTEDASVSSTSGNVRAERINGELRSISTSGNVTVNDAGARLFAQSISGNVTALQVRGDATVNATSGNIRLERVGGRAGARSNSGSVIVNDVSGDVQADSINNNVTVTNVRGRVTATAVSGSIIISKVIEGVLAKAVSGRVEISDSKGRIEVYTTSESIILNNLDSRDVRARSAPSGNVRFVGKLYDDGRYEFESFSGNIELILPPDSTFRLTARTHSGSINTEFPVQLAPQIPSRSLSGTVGKGGAEVRVSTFSGNIIIRKSVK